MWIVDAVIMRFLSHFIYETNRSNKYMLWLHTVKIYSFKGYVTVWPNG